MKRKKKEPHAESAASSETMPAEPEVLVTVESLSKPSEPVVTLPQEIAPPPPPVESAPPQPPPDTRRWYKKVSVQLPLYANAQRIQFEILDGNLGVLVTTDARVIQALDSFAKVKRGGVVILPGEQEYNDLKKKFPFRTSAPKYQPPKLKIWDNRPKQLSPSVSAPGAAAAVRSNPLSSVAGGSRGPAASVVGEGVGAGKSPTSFTPNLQRKSGVLKTPASGQFRADAGLPPNLPQG